MVEVVEDGHGLPPGFAGSVGVVGAAVGVAEVDEGVRFVIGVAVPVEGRAGGHSPAHKMMPQSSPPVAASLLQAGR
jgi:hypothetical protein